jgi:hypothetical protein
MLEKMSRTRINFSLDQFSGDLKTHVDGRPVVMDLRLLSVSLVKHYEFNWMSGKA